MLKRLSRVCADWAARAPWGPMLGAGRSTLALGTLLTLLATSSDVLFSAAEGRAPGPGCSGLAKVSIFCVVPSLEVARWVSIATLMLVVVGWRPRMTAIPHWIVAFSVFRSVTIPDGGDQITANLTFLLLPVCLLDPRRSHWHARDTSDDPMLSKLVAWSGVVALKIQVAVVYLHSGVAKLGVESWADGTAMHYILRDPTFGAPLFVQPWAREVLASGTVVAVMTWGVIGVEIVLGLALLLGKSLRPVLLVTGLLLHAAIAIFMGITTFSIAMMGALLLYIPDPNAPLPRVKQPRAQVVPHPGVA